MDFNTSLTNQIKTSFGIDTNGNQFPEVFNATLDYLCFRTKHAQYHKALAATGVNFSDWFTPKQFRLLILESSTILVNLRFFLFRLLKTPPSKLTADFARGLYHQYGIHKSDAGKVYRYVKLNRKQIIRNNKELTKFSLDEVQPNAIELLHKNIALHTKTLMDFAYKNARYKLRFVWSVNNDSPKSMATDLYIHALRAYKLMAPAILRRSELHQLNQMRTAINNQTVNLQKKFSSKKHGRMVNVGKDNKENAQYVLVVESQSQFKEMQDGTIPELGDAAVEPTQNRLIRDVGVAVTRMCDKYAGKKRCELLNILFNRKTGQFMRYLKSEGYVTNSRTDIIDVIGRIGRPRFFSVISAYLGVKLKTVESFVKFINKDLNVPEVVYA